MIEQLPKHEDEWAYYESEPLFDYVCQVSDMMGEIVTDINPDGSPASTTPHLQPFRFASDFLDGKIDTEEIKMDLYESSNIQDTLKAFGLDSSKFWYLCLFIKWKVDWECESARVFPKEPLEKLKNLQAEFEKLNFVKHRGKYVTSKSATLTFKVEGSRAFTIDDDETLAILNNIINDYLITTPIKGYLLHDSEKVELSIITEMYLFNKYLSWFLSPLTANKAINASYDKSLLVSRMIYVLGILRRDSMWREYNESGNKKNQLKGYLSKYKHPKYWHL